MAFSKYRFIQVGFFLLPFHTWQGAETSKLPHVPVAHHFAQLRQLDLIDFNITSCWYQQFSALSVQFHQRWIPSNMFFDGFLLVSCLLTTFLKCLVPTFRPGSRSFRPVQQSQVGAMCPWCTMLHLHSTHSLQNFYGRQPFLSASTVSSKETYQKTVEMSLTQSPRDVKGGL